MKSLSKLLFLSVVAGLLVGLTVMPDQRAWAVSSSQVPNPGDFFAADPNAPGRQVNGTLNIFYVVVDFFSEDCSGAPKADMHVNMRATKSGDKKTEVTVGKTFHGVCYLEPEAHGGQIKAFIDAELIPKLFPNPINASTLKYVQNLVQDAEGAGTDANPFFVMTDFTVVVDE